MSPAETLAILPFVRRYARALTGSQREGDIAVARAIGHPSHRAASRLGLYARITRLTRLPVLETERGALTPVERELLLLTSLEAMAIADAADVVGLGVSVATGLLAHAREVLRAASAVDVLIIEDEPVIAMDMRAHLEDCGHRVIGIAASEEEAMRLAAEGGVGLIVADINLGEGGSGMEAVRQILDSVKVPVIFVSAYPELLLTAQVLEPAFVMNKPFDPATLGAFVYQATNLGLVALQ